MSARPAVLRALWLGSALAALGLPAQLGAQGSAAGRQAVMEAWRAGEMITARGLAEALLLEDPEAIEGHFVLGQYYRMEEGNLAQAWYHFETGHDAWVARDFPMGEGNWQLHSQLLWGWQNLAGNMDRNERQLELCDLYDSMYDPDLIEERAWPLMKLERYDEARDWASRAAESKEPWPRLKGLNALCAIEAEQGRRDEAFTACLAALEWTRQTGVTSVTIDASNASTAAIAVLRFDEAYELAEESAGGTVEVANPWETLTQLHMDRARMPEAIDAAASMQRWQAGLEPNLRDQGRADGDGVLAALLLVAGRYEEANRVIDRALEFPDRRGTTSSAPEHARGGHTLLRLSIEGSRAALRAEDAVAEGFTARLMEGVTRLGSWAPVRDEAALLHVLGDSDRLVRTLRVYTDGGIAAPVWLLGDLVPRLGAGVVQAALEEVRALETHPGISAYHDAIEAEVAAALGDRPRALELAAQALEGLPVQEQLLRARVAAVAADLSWREGGTDAALAYYQQVLRIDPGTLRRLGLALPVAIDAAEDPVLQRAARRLGASPRLRSDALGFPLTLSVAGDGVQACLSSGGGSRLGCTARVSGTDEEGEPLSPSDHAAALVRAVHRELLVVELAGARIDMRSLDVSTIARDVARSGSAEVLDQLSR